MVLLGLASADHSPRSISLRASAPDSNCHIRRPPCRRTGSCTTRSPIRFPRLGGEGGSGSTYSRSIYPPTVCSTRSSEKRRLRPCRRWTKARDAVRTAAVLSAVLWAAGPLQPPARRRPHARSGDHRGGSHHGGYGVSADSPGTPRCRLLVSHVSPLLAAQTRRLKSSSATHLAEVNHNRQGCRFATAHMRTWRRGSGGVAEPGVPVPDPAETP